MVAFTEEPRRCVVWFGQPTAQERASVARAGWMMRVAGLDATRAGIGFGEHDSLVAVADLRDAQAHDAQALERAMRQVAVEHPGVPWLALLPRDPPVPSSLMARLLRAVAACLATPLQLQQLVDVLDRLDREHGPGLSGGELGMVGRSAAMRVVAANIRKFAPVGLPVLITGETGTGKEMAARALHRLSTRSNRPFVAINCGALPANLVQSELFGHERGAFTGANVRRIGHFEAADGGSVFLDEVGDLPMDAQTSLLRLLQESTLERVGSSQSIKLNVRVLAATHVDLERAVAHGQFREDLYYRLNVLRLRMPALRERGEDIELLAQQCLDAFRDMHGTLARGFSVDARDAMRAFHWPGNVRELLNRVQRAAVVAEDRLIHADDLELHDLSLVPFASLGMTRGNAERDAVVACLRDSGFNISECARRLKVSRVTVYRLCKKHQLVVEALR